MSVLERNNVKVSGNGEQPIMFAHGFGCDQQMWRFVAPAFKQTHKVVLFDHLGAGQSDLAAYDSDTHTTLHGYADDVLAIAEELDLTNMIFVGHSVSTMIGVLAAIKAPHRFAKLVLVAPSPSFINDGDYIGGFGRSDIEELLEAMDGNYMGWSSNVTPMIAGNPDHPEFAEELNNSFCRTDPTIAKEFARVTFLTDHRADLPKVTIPTLIIQSAHDALAPLTVGEYMQRTVPDNELVTLDVSGHCPHLSAPMQTIAAIQQFV